MGTKTALKTLSNNTYPTNGVRAIDAADVRAFNDELIDSLDVITHNGIDKQIKKDYVRFELFLTASDTINRTTGFLMNKVKDALLSNVLEIRIVHFCNPSGSIEPILAHYSPSFIVLYKSIDAINHPGDLCVKTLGVAPYNGLVPFGAGVCYPLVEITYIPAT